MTPEAEAPVAQSDEQLPVAEDGSAADPTGEEQTPAAAATQEDPNVKKLRDRLAEQGRKNAELNRLAQQQAQQLATLSTQMQQVSQFMSQQQQQAVRAQLAQMEPEQQIAFLTEQVLRPRPAPAPAPVQVAPASDPQAVMDAHLEALNDELGLTDDPVTPEEVGYHATEAAWLKAARLIGNAKAKENAVPAKKADNKPVQQPDISELVAKEVARVTGVGRPNTASPTGGRANGPSIADLNKLAADTSLSPRARAEKMRQLTGV
jgi:hypothetical protein